MKIIDDFLNKTVMYRLVLYVLIGLVLGAAVLGFVGSLPYSGWEILLAATFLSMVCLATNEIFAKVFEVTPNIESVYITALILALIITPGLNATSLALMFWAGVLAMTAKYILVYKKRHLFNPAAVAVAATALVLNQSASWWVGTTVMLPLVAIGGFLIVRKIRRADLLIAFLVTAIITTTLFVLLGSGNHTAVLSNLKTMLLYTSLFFFGTIMLTEPLTTPPTRNLQIIYGGLVGIMFAPQFHLGSFYFTPELALLAGNIFAFVVSPKERLILTLKEKVGLGKEVFDYVFTPSQKFAFTPGQYLEWTLPVPQADTRGNRRYFTIASSPTEADLRIGVKFYDKPSRFKETMHNLKPNDKIVASHLAGSFVLPNNPQDKLVFIAGGIGVTPFRSMIKYLIDTGQKRDIVLFYSAKTADEIVYSQIFREAQQKFNLKVIYTLSDIEHLPAGWTGEKGFIDEAMIKKYVPDYHQRTFYLSGPNSMVVTFDKLLRKMSVRKIKKDYFPGF